MDEQVLEVESRSPHPGGVVEEVESKARRLAALVGDQAGIDGVGPKSVTQQAILRRSYGVRRPLVYCQSANEGQDLRNIRLGRGPNRGCHVFILECDTDHTKLPTGRTTMVGKNFFGRIQLETHDCGIQPLARNIRPFDKARWHA
jgi:hypothetical protein